jgi:hypothetical protein
MKRKVFAGITSLSLPIIVYDNTSTTGAGLSGLTNSTSGLVLEYRRQGQASWTSVTLVSKTLGTYTSGGIVASGSRAGRYEIDIPDAAVAAGSRMVEICLRGAANQHPVDIEIELDAVNYQDATAFGLSRLDAATSSRMATYTQPTGFLAATFPGTIASTTNITAASGITLAAVTHTGATIPTVTLVSQLAQTALSVNDAFLEVVPLVWEQSINDTWPNNSFGERVLVGNTTQRSVAVTATHHVASVLHDANPDSIPEDAFITGALSARALAADAATEIATAVGTLQALTRLDSMIESDGAGQFRFDTIALSMAPAGGGGGTDWTSSERIAIRGILGFNSSGVIALPSEGVLDSIKDKTDLITSGTVQTSLPVTAAGQIASPLVIGDDYLNSNGRAFSWTVALPTGYSVGTSTCKFGMRYEDSEGVNSFVANGTVIDAGSGNVTLRFDVPKTTTNDLRAGWYDWSVEIANATSEITPVKSGKNAEWQYKQT